MQIKASTAIVVQKCVCACVRVRMPAYLFVCLIEGSSEVCHLEEQLLCSMDVDEIRGLVHKIMPFARSATASSLAKVSCASDGCSFISAAYHLSIQWFSTNAAGGCKKRVVFACSFAE